MTRTIVAFDTETATARGAPHLLELGAVRTVGGEIVDRFERLVRPEVPIDRAASDVHGLRDEDVIDAQSAPVVLEAFTRWCGDDWLVAHNAAFDASVLAFEAARHDAALPSGPLLDTLKLARRCLPEAPDHKLETLCEHLGLDVEVHHRALADAVSCWLVFDECRARLVSALDVEGFGEAIARGAVLPTLALARPKTPRIPQRLRPLVDACATRAPLTLLYGEEGAPAVLPVVPRLVYELGSHGYLEAECVRSSTLKTYRLDRVRRLLTR